MHLMYSFEFYPHLVSVILAAMAAVSAIYLIPLASKARAWWLFSAALVLLAAGLEAFRQLQPDTARILFSGHADRDVLVKAINDSKIYGYIEKPWHEYVLKNTVSQAVAYRNLLRENHRLAELMAP